MAPPSGTPASAHAADWQAMSGSPSWSKSLGSWAQPRVVSSQRSVVQPSLSSQVTGAPRTQPRRASQTSWPLHQTLSSQRDVSGTLAQRPSLAQ